MSDQTWYLSVHSTARPLALHETIPLPVEIPMFFAATGKAGCLTGLAVCHPAAPLLLRVSLGQILKLCYIGAARVPFAALRLSRSDFS